MAWAFRATDLGNYYDTKLVMTKPGPLLNAGLVGFIVLDGRERERVELPLPLILERGRGLTGAHQRTGRPLP
jgi:hypothetical protein